MPKQRKTDKYRLLEGRGCGRGLNYKPWIKVHEFSNLGCSSRLKGIKVERGYQLMSKGELEYFVLLEWSDKVLDIREQYPLLPVEQTNLIAKKLGIRHPKNNVTGEEYVMSTDFVITIKDGNMVKDIARTYKPSEFLKSERVIEKFMIEEEYWRIKGIDWGIVTEEQIPKTLAKNLIFLRNTYYWDKEINLSNDVIKRLKTKYISRLLDCGTNLVEVANQFDIENHWQTGESLKLLGHLIIKKEIETDLNIELNFRDMEIWLPRKG